MRVKTSELIDHALDWAVDSARGYGADYLTRWNIGGDTRFVQCEIIRAYSTDWGIGGAIIEREGISLEWSGWGGDEQWIAYLKHDDEFKGPTPLIAAMRCYVASKLGDEVDIPDELME